MSKGSFIPHSKPEDVLDFSKPVGYGVSTSYASSQFISQDYAIDLPPLALPGALRYSRSHWSMNLRFLVVFLIPVFPSVAATDEDLAIARILAGRDSAEPLPDWVPLQQAEPALAEGKLIRGLLDKRQSYCPSSWYNCGSG